MKRRAGNKQTNTATGAILPLCLVILSALPACAGNSPRLPLTRQPIEEFGSNALAGFFASLADTETQRAASGRDVPAITRIVHYGDSHIAADLLTGILRQRSQRDFGDAGIGFLPAGCPWAWYSRSSAELASSAGWRRSTASVSLRYLQTDDSDFPASALPRIAETKLCGCWLKERTLKSYCSGNRAAAQWMYCWMKGFSKDVSRWLRMKSSQHTLSFQFLPGRVTTIFIPLNSALSRLAQCASSASWLRDIVRASCMTHSASTALARPACCSGTRRLWPTTCRGAILI